VVDSLATVLSRIDNSPIPVLEPLRPSDFCSGPMQMPNQGIVLFACVGDRSHVLAGNDKDVNRGLRIDVGEGIALVILIDGLGGDASIDDSAKDAAHA
jgi:hypothetical protein